MITTIQGTCSFENCTLPATHIACGRKELDFKEGKPHPIPACYCEAHAESVSIENLPEYDVSCPNCGCLFGCN